MTKPDLMRLGYLEDKANKKTITLAIHRNYFCKIILNLFLQGIYPKPEKHKKQTIGLHYLEHYSKPQSPTLYYQDQ